MVIVVVAEQHRVNFGQVFKGDTGLGHAFGAGKGQGAGARGPHRVGQDVDPGGLDEERGVADHGDGHIVDACGGFDGMDLHRFWSCAALAIELPFQKGRAGPAGRHHRG